MREKFPFTAIVGQDELLLGIILNIINPQLGGLLIQGVKGSGKSTAVYSMNELIPEIETFEGCNFNCNPEKPESFCEECRKNNSPPKEVINKGVKLVPVPLSVTEDRLLGNVDVELLLKEGKHRFIPGILARANRQILYIDEVNLLPDHIVDDILDVSATGWNYIEREGFSLSHPSKFLLIGTMNPEEGELRPQILDRFPLSVSIASVTDPALRKEIIKRNLAFEENPADFIDLFRTDTDNLKDLITISKTFLDKVQVTPTIYDLIAEFCSANNIDGHRADIGIIKTASTHAAFEMKTEVELRHIRQAAKFFLCHRTREGGLTKPLTPQEIDDYFDKINQNKFQRAKTSGKIDINRDIGLFSEEDLVQLEKKVVKAFSDVITWLETQGLAQIKSEIPDLPVRYAEETGLSKREIALLREMIRMRAYLPSFGSFTDEIPKLKVKVDEKRGSSSLKDSRSPFPFNDLIPNKVIEKFIERIKRHSNRIKVLSESVPKFRTIYKNGIYDPVEQKKNFSITVNDLQKVQLSMTKRERIDYSFDSRIEPSPDKGRIVRFTDKKTTQIALTQTLLNAVKKGNYSLEEKRFNINPKNFLYPKFESSVCFNMMLILDTSRSITSMMHNIEAIITHITTKTFHLRDRLGLITFQNDRAQIHHYPTRNVKQVIGTVNKIKTRGATPLGDGLNLALQIFSRERYNIKGMKNIIIMISDCYPEPLKGGYENLMEDPCYLSVINASEKIKKAKIDLMIINPSVERCQGTWNIKLIDKIIEVSGAKYVRIYPRTLPKVLRGKKSSIRKRDSINLTETLWKMKTGLE